MEDTVVPGLTQPAEERAQSRLRLADEIFVAHLQDLVTGLPGREFMRGAYVADPGPGGPAHALETVEAAPGVDDIAGVTHDVQDLGVGIQGIDVVEHQRV